jgi:NTP pyrophosphatase (non-canonical NTP hydrolase)
LVLCENQSQIAKYGIETNTPFEWLAFLTEEQGELAQAVIDLERYGKGSESRIIDEAIQVATLALKIAEMYGT